MLHEGGRSRARLWWVLELGGSFLGANFPFLPAGLVCSVVLGLNLRAGPGAAADTPVDSFRL